MCWSYMSGLPAEDLEIDRPWLIWSSTISSAQAPISRLTLVDVDPSDRPMIW